MSIINTVNSVLIELVFVYCSMSDYGMYGCVYLIECTETGRIKIGRSRNIKNRFDGVNVCSPTVLKVYYNSPPIKGYCKLELFLHKKYWEYRYKGEWFNVDKELVKSDIEQFCLEDDIYVVYEKYKSGLNATEIAKELGVSRNNIVRHLSYWDIKPSDKDSYNYKSNEKGKYLTPDQIQEMVDRSKKKRINKRV